MSKKSLVIPLIVLLAAAGLLFAIAGHWTEWEGRRADLLTANASLLEADSRSLWQKRI